jgi:hypothetical protein
VEDRGLAHYWWIWVCLVGWFGKGISSRDDRPERIRRNQVFWYLPYIRT